MSINPSSSAISGVTVLKPAFEKFNKEEVKYLKQRLPEYITTISQGPTKKGDKGEWVIQHILPDFKSRFGYSADGDGASMESLCVVRSALYPVTIYSHRLNTETKALVYE